MSRLTRLELDLTYHCTTYDYQQPDFLIFELVSGNSGSVIAEPICFSELLGLSNKCEQVNAESLNGI